MPTRKRATKQTNSTRKAGSVKSSRTLRPLAGETSDIEINTQIDLGSRRSGLGKKIFFIILILLILLFLAYRNRGMFFAARVNGWPITRLELNEKMTQRYGSLVLDDLIDEHIIRQEASSKGIKVTPEEINVKVEEVRKQIGEGVNLEDFLKERGFSLSDFRKQIEVQILVEKLTAGAVNVSDQEIKDFIDQNRANMTATDEAGLNTEALNFLTSRKKNEAVQKWFTDLKNGAKVTKYL